MKKIIILLILTFAFFNNAFAYEPFVVKKIDVKGANIVSSDTVKSYLSVKVGDKLYPSDSGDAIRSLYESGFFDHISLSRSNNTLIVTVVERPIIAQLKISGNSVVPTDKLKEVMYSVNIKEGRVYDRAQLEKIKMSLLNQYYQIGRYNATVGTRVSSLGKGRILLHVIISEGKVAKVRGVNLVGVKSFSAFTLNRRLTISKPNLFTFFTQKDKYSQEKLEESLENIRSFYLDRGYLKFDIKSSQASITPDRKSIYITVVISEGEKYTVSGVDITGNTVVPKEDLMKLVFLKPKDTFSRGRVKATQKYISAKLGNEGYAFSQIAVMPKVDEKNHKVFITFDVRPGKKTYVKNITFSNNAKTNDEVLRREMEQMEGSTVSSIKLDQSKMRLNRLPYVKEVEMKMTPVKGTDDQVDVDYRVEEDSAAQANFSMGYSQLDHILFSAGLNQKNFLGTGNTLGMNLSASKFQKFYSINFMNPYFTDDGISRNTSLTVSRFDPKYANSSSSYTMNQYSFSDIFGIPLGNEPGVFNRLQLGYGYENVIIDVHGGASVQVLDFTEDHGNHYQQLDIITAFSRDSRDRYLFPTRGMVHTLGANLYLPVSKNSSLSYYILNYSNKWYQPLAKRFILTGRAEVGYGNSFSGDAEDFPFFKNFYAGGITSVRGYEGNRLGPRDSNGNSTGGNFLIDGSLGLVLPNYVSSNLRTTLYFDAGNVYYTYSYKDKYFNNVPDEDGNFSPYSTEDSAGPVRFSAGIEFDWLTPMGLIDISFAKPFNAQRGEAEVFQFSIGANFG